MDHFNGNYWQCACAVSHDRVVGGPYLTLPYLTLLYHTGRRFTA